MPDDAYEAALCTFTEDLNRVHRAAGSPSYARIEMTSDRLRLRGGPAPVITLSKSNTCEILNGRRQQLKWDWVRSYVIVLRSMARSNGFSADSIGSVDEWRRKYEALRAAAGQAARRPVTLGRHRKQDSPGNTGRTGPPAPEEAPSSEVLRLMRQTSPPQWLHRYRDIAPRRLNDYVYLESAAKVVRTYEPEVLPGLLQAESYARAILRRYCPDASDNEVARMTELRMHRQERLQKPGFQLWAVIEESALRNHQVDVQAMRSQITHLINVSEQENVTLQVRLTTLRPELDDHLTLKEPITHFRLPPEDLDDVIFIERPPDGVILTDRKEIEHYSHLLSLLGSRSASANDVQELLRKIFTEL